jgi:preprotein translocase subunit SecE
MNKDTLAALLTITILCFFFWLLDDWKWWFGIGLAISSYLSYKGDLRYKKAYEEHKRANAELGLDIAPEATLGERANPTIGIIIGGVIIGLIFCTVDNMFYWLFQA